MPFIQDESSVDLFNRGNKLYEEKEYDKASIFFKQVLEKNPYIYQIHINIGNCYRDKGEYDKAIEEYNLVIEAVKTKTGNLKGDMGAAKALANVGECFLRKGNIEAAQQNLKAAIDNYPNDEYLAFNVGELYFSEGQTEKAIEYFELASQINPKWADPYLKLGYVYLNQTNYAKGLQYFKKFLELESDSPRASTVRDIIITLEKK